MGGDGEAVRGERLVEGKTKIVYADPMDPALAVIVHKDDITAGDGARRNRLPGKGALSGRTTSNVFRLLRASGIPTHFVDAPAADEMVVRRCDMIPLEVVMRRIATGSYLKRNDVPEGTRFDRLWSSSSSRMTPITTRSSMRIGSWPMTWRRRMRSIASPKSGGASSRR